MRSLRTETVRTQLRAIFALIRDDPRTDEELLGRFAEDQDEDAFSALVGRHGPLVWRTCCRVLGEGPDAEDAFQVTFLTLTRWAKKLRRGELAGWLFQVARRAAQDLRAAAQRRRRLEGNASTAAGTGQTDEPDQAETSRLLDEELASLPEKLRVPMVLRYLEGKTLEEVARILGCSRRAVGKRLDRAEAILRERLSCRGLVIGGGALVGLLVSSASAQAVRGRLIAETTQAAMAFCAGTLNSTAAQVALGLMPGKASWTLKTWLIILLGVGSLFTGVVGWHVMASAPAPAPAPSGGLDSGSNDAAVKPRLDRHGDALPDKALARLGTLRWQQEGSIRDTFSLTVALTANGKYLLTTERCTGPDDKPLRLWDLKTGKVIRSLGNGLGRDGAVSVTVGAVSPDGRLAILQVVGGKVCLWDLTEDRELRHWQGADAPYLPGAFSPDGRSLVLMNRAKREEAPCWLRSYAVDSGKELLCFRGAADPVQHVAFTADGKTVVAAGLGTAYRWEAGTGKELSHFVFEPVPLGPSTVVLAADGQTLAVSNGRHPGAIAIWNTKEGKEVRSWQTERHASIPWLALSPDGRTLASVSWGSSGAFALWDTATGKELVGSDYEWYQHAVFSADSRTLVCTHPMSNALTLLDVPSGKERTAAPAHHEALKGVLPVGRTLALTWTRSRGDVWLWERATGKEVRQLSVSQEARVLGAAAAPDGTTVAVAEATKNGQLGLHVWETASGREVWSAQWPGETVTCLTFTPDGKRLAANDGTAIRVWDAGSGKEVANLRRGPAAPASQLHFLPDGQLLTWAERSAGRPNRQLVLCWWDLDKATVVRKEVVSGVAARAVVSADGKFLACVASLTEVLDGKAPEGVQLYDLTRAVKVATVPAVVRAPHVDGGGPLSFSPDGKLLATATPNGNIEIWRTATGDRLGTLAGHWGGVTTLAFSSDGRTLLSGSADTTGLVWDITDLVAPR